MDANRKLLIVLAVIGVVIVLVYGAGLTGALSGGSSSGAGWQGRFGGGPGSGQLTVADLEPAETGCQITGSTVVVTNLCALNVVPIHRRFGFSRVTRKAMLSAQNPVRLVVILSGQTLNKDVDPGTPVTVTFGRDGGLLQVTCRSQLAPCAIALSAEATT